MTEKKRQITISKHTEEKVEAAKNFIEQRYSTLIKQEKEKKEYWDELNRKMQMLNIPLNQQ